jgi:ribosomal protein S18 acetylase RimI-like enzyme
VRRIEIRPCRRDDLRALEWDGEFRCERALFARVFERTVTGGGMAMLVAASGREHLGQIWVDLARDPTRAILWALRVKPAHCGRGLGTALIAAGEQLAVAAGRACIDLEVEPHNLRAGRLYERLGYLWIRRELARDAFSGEPLGFEIDVLRRVLP